MILCSGLFYVEFILSFPLICQVTRKQKAHNIFHMKSISYACLNTFGALMGTEVLGPRIAIQKIENKIILNRICNTVAVPGKVYLHQHMGLGRAEQNCTFCLSSCLYSTVRISSCLYSTEQLPGDSRGWVDFCCKTDTATAQNYVWNRLRLLKIIKLFSILNSANILV